jgi:hypothetical protein
MAYAFYYDAPGNEQIYRLVSQAIGKVRPEGLIAAVVTKTDTGLRHLDVWQSREQWLNFRDGQVRPAVAAVLADLGIPAPAEPPHEHELALVDVTP